ncbi:hypothetical protein FC40_GL000510 [Ligilactobacillus hayakitensis DSM 18933 = JCM 14209]|uniref:CRM domain-containing protein n=1 Tax=Ligilactobacillus hayakitensis DSM 18933 = JCM 14209 TaxID=1423755 RepID=A0A0R1WLH9_9LACO|nr:ribosome assembly RNA-binding protein YhbY [Ligilactobacillus hayakitensis]KRM18728.1 hypothetical protein FC40_GL000510 [Ligilactobacillus hayakitensis DSM 18933 = JCM 14209]
MNLRGKQKRFLRSKAHGLNPIFQVGKDGFSEIWLEEVDKALDRRELIKVNILQNSLVETDELKAFIEENSSINVVQIIGNVLVLFKVSSSQKHRQISDEVKSI